MGFSSQFKIGDIERYFGGIQSQRFGSAVHAWSDSSGAVLIGLAPGSLSASQFPCDLVEMLTLLACT